MFGRMFSFLLSSAFCVPVVYSSAIQLKGIYTKNRIGITTESDAASYRQPVIYSSRPPYDSGWFWTIEPDEENISLARTAVLCDSILSLSSTVTGSYLSTKVTQNQTEVVPATSNQGSASQWILKCENGPIWRQGDAVLFMNLKHKCYLQTGFQETAKGAIDKYAVNCRGIASGALWKAVEGIYFPINADEFGESDRTMDADL
jgi:hypothetical protein